MTETVSDTDMNDCLSPSQEREYTLILGETASISGEKKKSNLTHQHLGLALLSWEPGSSARRQTWGKKQQL